MKTYRKIATVQAKIFEEGDEDGFINPNAILGQNEDDFKFSPILVPYIKTLENQCHKGKFGQYYLCVGIDGERWLVEKSIFERTYELVNL